MRYLVLILALSIAACGGSSTSGVTTADVQRLNTLSQNVSSAVGTYGTQAATMTDSTSCNGAEITYDSHIRPMVSEIQGMGTAMDDKMGSLNHTSDADMECGANAMMAELDHHKTVACASATDMAPNKTEAQQHIANMTQWANHEMVRSDGMGSTMGMEMGGMGGGGITTGHCAHNPNGSYTMHP